MVTPTVTVIIPAYNAERFLEEALACVYAQTMRDFELVVVDDGSTDATGAICDRAAAADARVRAVHTANAGVSAARNLGLEQARGRWIFFMDADDLMPSDALATLLEAAEAEGAELSTAPFAAFSDKAPRTEGRGGGRRRLMTGREAVEAGMYQRRLDPGPWGKLYAAELWDGVRFREGIRYEDLDVFYRVWIRARKVVFSERPLYFYRQHDGSFIHRFTRERLDALDVTDRMADWAAADHAELFPAARDRRMSAHFNILLLMYKNGVRLPEVEKRCIDVIADSAPASVCNGRVRLKNRLGALAYILGGRKALRLMSRFIKN